MRTLSIIVIIVLMLGFLFAHYTKILRFGPEEEQIESPHIQRKQQTQDLDDLKRRQELLMEERQRKLRDARNRYK